MMIPFLIPNCHLWSTDAVNEFQQRQNAKRLQSVVVVKGILVKKLLGLRERERWKRKKYSEFLQTAYEHKMH